MASATRERLELEEEIERLHMRLDESAAEARRRQDEAVGELLDLIVQASRREQDLEDSLAVCVEAIDGLVGMQLGGSEETRAMWRERLDAAWRARNRATAHLPGHQPGEALKQAS